MAETEYITLDELRDALIGSGENAKTTADDKPARAPRLGQSCASPT